jgi:predicted nuclease with TOPRIM domain
MSETKPDTEITKTNEVPANTEDPANSLKDVFNAYKNDNIQLVKHSEDLESKLKELELQQKKLEEEKNNKINELQKSLDKYQKDEYDREVKQLELDAKGITGALTEKGFELTPDQITFAKQIVSHCNSLHAKPTIVRSNRGLDIDTDYKKSVKNVLGDKRNSNSILSSNFQSIKDRIMNY